VTIGGGTNLLARDEHDPLPIFNRGLYFNSTAFLKTTGLTLHHSWALTSWLRV
jgi:hypothetical protein